MTRTSIIARGLLPLLASVTTLGGCGGSSSGGTSPSQAPSQAYTVGGSVSGLASGKSVGLLDSNGDALTVSANSTFAFTTALPAGSAYSVTVGTQPSGQLCQITGGAGNVSTSNVTGVLVSCATVYAIGGPITGLGGATGLVLANGDQSLTVPTGATNFAMPAADGTGYDVTVQTNPTLLACTIAGGAGTVKGADIDSISVSCEPGTESILYSFAGPPTDGSNPASLIQGLDGSFYGVTEEGGSVTANQYGYGTAFKITAEGTETVMHYFAGGTTDGAYPVSLIPAIDGTLYGATGQGGANGGGIFFKITSDGREAALYSFSSTTTDASLPISLILASNGNYYGLTDGGGVYSPATGGTVFTISASGAETLIHSFPPSGRMDGYDPRGSLLQGLDGNLYGVAAAGGVNGAGAIFKITPDGTETILHSFGGNQQYDGFLFDGAPTLVQASDGNFYGMTDSGGVNGQGTVFRVTSDGIETVLYSFAGGSTDGAVPYGNLIQASDGNLYGATSAGGASNVGVVFRITLDGTETVLYSFAGGPTDGASPTNLLQARDGSLYGITLVGGSSNEGTIFKLN
ncbi:MAG TPA: choice-of-anchor tandem repeat GloVer-containing protein [Steroidobacteraceae bacterium]|nr:choice-of-anchor tandem repeat GloVer-containing protein [Steroidobacteraceae bacterium]